MEATSQHDYSCYLGCKATNQTNTHLFQLTTYFTSFTAWRHFSQIATVAFLMFLYFVPHFLVCFQIDHFLLMTHFTSAFSFYEVLLSVIF